MTDFVLFHHVRGLTDGVRAFADRLRERGHRVETPDCFDGRTFATIDEGIAYARSTGFDLIEQRALAAAADLARPVVYGGMSLGSGPAQQLLLSDSGALGGVLLHGFTPLEAQGPPWRDDVPVQLHAMDADPWVVDDGELEAARAVQREHPNLEVCTYPGSGHLFTDETDVDYDAAAAQSVLERVAAMLDAIDSGAVRNGAR